MAAGIEDRLQALEDLAQVLADPADLKNDEGPSSVNWRGEVAPEKLATIDQPRLDRWFQAFGAELTLTCTCAAANLDWSATQEEHDAAALEHLLAECATYGTPPMILAIDVAKPDLKKLIPGFAAEAVLFFWAAALGEILAKTDERFFEDEFLGIPEDETDAADRRLVILVADEDGLLQGPCLAVLGKNHHGGIAAALGPPPSWDSIRAARELTRDASPREDWPRLLTPDYFELKKKDGLSGCLRALARLRERLVVSSLANRTFKTVRRQPGVPPQTFWTSVFTGTRAVEVTLDGAARPAGKEDPPGPLLLYRWVHEDGKTARTRLEIVRRVTALQLLPRSADNFDLFAAQSEQILADSKVQLEVLIEGNVIASFERRQKLEETVQKYVQDVGGRIAALGKEVVDNTYRTVGLLVGIAIAYFLKPDQGVTLVAVAIGLYVLYVGFVRWFYIGSVNKDFKSEQAFFKQRWENMKPELKFFDEGFTTRLREEITDKDNEFSKRYGFVHWLYIGFIAAGVAVLLFLLNAHEQRSTAAVRARLLARQAQAFAGLGYRDIRVDLPGSRRPAPLAVDGQRLVPDLTAVKDDPAGTPVLVELVPCSQIEDGRQLASLQGLKKAADRSKAELHLLTEAECRQAGDDRAREWLAAKGFGDLKVWAW